MTKNEWSAENAQIMAVRDDIKHNHGFGSLYQFFLCAMLDKACEYFGTGYEKPSVNVKIDYDTLDRLCIRLLDSIGN